MSITAEAIWAAAPSTTRGAPTPLSSDARGKWLAYAANKSIFVRSIDNPSVSKQYTGHTATTTVARFSPSGFYVASGDVTGSVRVWDAAGAEQTKGEYHVIAGRINDIAWDGDSQRIIAVGDGKQRYGHCFTADSGNSVGEISGHSGPINCVSIRPCRPLRAATGSDDTSLCFFHGAPFKFNTNMRDCHDKYVYGAAFSPDGALLVSVGSDRRIWLYNGVSGEVVKSIGEGEHTSSIFGVAWSPDGKMIVTCSGDQTVRVWEVDSGQCVRVWRMGEGVPNQQVGVTWPAGRKDGLIISLDLEGNLNYLLLDQGSGPVRIVRGHQKAITAAAYVEETNVLCTGSSDGKMRVWDANGVASAPTGEVHANYISGMTVSGGQIFSVGWDDTLRNLGQEMKLLSKTTSQPRGVAIIGGKCIVATGTGLLSFPDGKDIDLPTPLSIAATTDLVAVGSEDKTTYILSSAFSDAGKLEVGYQPTALSFSPDGGRLAIGLSNGKIFVYARISGHGDYGWKLETNRWSAHTARVTSLDWSPDGNWAVSGGLDTNVFVWSVADPGLRIKALNAHKEGVGAVAWGGDRVMSCGTDGAVRIWSVKH
ncbi:WD40 repeat-like protein [Piedraia hortae CBS 480.64]|uniref:WD40 repeat-like protein n=1 Tax=Piedraia hortae CBS 480.64 TaxID=1314780 RepID=A0A6A7BS99_9PEZI|nr:WD40 repeat-like protein [Piedraia hortae CBS 480.64]